MILEAFAKHLQRTDSNLHATDILAAWLWERLSANPTTTVDKILHCELSALLVEEVPKKSVSVQMSGSNSKKLLTYVFKGNSGTGSQLLHSLYEYSLSYEQQKWSRFIHKLKASDFNYYLNKND